MVAVAPRIPGLSVRVVDLGNHLELVNRTAVDVIVLGYGGEPYLRVGPDGVFENENSAATYLDRTRYGTTPVPSFATTQNATTHPRWKRISGGETVRWHDHRIHWMGAGAPPQVQVAPSGLHHLGPPWHVAMLYGTRRIAVTGQLDWVPGPSGRPWLPLILVCAALGAAATFRRRSIVPLVCAVIVLVTADAFHSIATELFRPGTSIGKMVQFFGDSFVSIIVWIAAIPTVLALRRRAPEALYGTMFVATMIALVGGVTDLSYLWKSQLPTVGPDALQRAAVCLSLGLGAGIATVSIGRLIRAGRSGTSPEVDDANVWLPLLVRGLSDADIGRLAGELDANEVIDAALGDVAARVPTDNAHVFDGGVAFRVLVPDGAGSHRWVIERRGDALGAAPDDAGGRAEICTTFPTFHRLLGGTLRIEDAVETGRCVTAGDQHVVDDASRWLVAATRVGE